MGELFDLLAQTSGKIILGAGDWHIPHAIEYRHDFQGQAYYFLEILSSSMTFPRFMYDNSKYVREENRVLYNAPEDRQVFNWAKFTVDPDLRLLTISLESLSLEIPSPMFSTQIDLDGSNLLPYEHVPTFLSNGLKTEL